MKTNYYILLAIIALLLFTHLGCKKFPEDSSISFATAKQRLQGEWKITKIEINGEDVGYKYNDSLAPLTYTDYYFRFAFNRKVTADDDRHNLLIINKSSKKSVKLVEEADVCVVDFGLDTYDRKDYSIGINKSTNLVINDSVSYKLLTNLLAHRDNWETRMLHHRHLIIQLNSNINNYRIYFNKIRL
jgi:hypothetical protein